MNILTTISNLISGKKPETPEEHIARLTKVAQDEEQTTKTLREKVEEQKMIDSLQKKVLAERKEQLKLYSEMGADNPQVQKSKRIRMYVFIGIAIIFVLVIAKSCFK